MAGGSNLAGLSRTSAIGTQLHGFFCRSAIVLSCLPITTQRADSFVCAAFDGERLIAALFVSRDPVAVSRSWLSERIGTSFAASHERLSACWPDVPAAQPGQRRHCLRVLRRRPQSDHRQRHVWLSQRGGGRACNAGRHKLRLLSHRHREAHRWHSRPESRLKRRRRAWACWRSCQSFLELAGKRAVMCGWDRASGMEGRIARSRRCRSACLCS